MPQGGSPWGFYFTKRKIMTRKKLTEGNDPAHIAKINSQIWLRLGVTVTLDKSIKEYKNGDEIVEAIIKAVDKKSFEVDGNSYVPEGVIEELIDELKLTNLTKEDIFDWYFDI